MHKKFQVNRTKIKGGCQSETKAAHCYSCTDLTLVENISWCIHISKEKPQDEKIDSAFLTCYHANRFPFMDFS